MTDKETDTDIVQVPGAVTTHFVQLDTTDTGFMILNDPNEGIALVGISEGRAVVSRLDPETALSIGLQLQEVAILANASDKRINH
jgi:hypothetical protein